MSLALAEEFEFDSALVAPALCEVAGPGPLSLHLLGGGRNSRVYRVDRGDRPDGESFVAKIYYDAGRAVEETLESKPGRDRCGCEFSALRFLWQNNVRCIPEPIATFPEQSLSIFRLVEGTPLRASDVEPRDIDALLEFLIQLDAAKHLPASRALANASEASFSLDALAESIRVRLVPLQSQADLAETPATRALAVFLKSKIRPALERALDSASAIQLERGLAIEHELPLASRTLSPSDFGFHNALRRPDGSLAFVDFEHFGWDDPAKMVADFLLHPALPIPAALRRRFLERAIERHPACGELGWRVPLVLPLYGIKWCTILLNEFVPEHARRRAFAAQRVRDDETLLFEQLAKAKSLLASATSARGEILCAG